MSLLIIQKRTADYGHLGDFNSPTQKPSETLGLCGITIIFAFYFIYQKISFTLSHACLNRSALCVDETIKCKFNPVALLKYIFS